jgi:hypothetical protein
MASLIRWHGPVDVKFSGDADRQDSSETYYAEMSGPLVNPKMEIMLLPQCPKIYSRKHDDATAFCINVEIEQDMGAKQIYVVNVQYTNRLDVENKQYDNPLQKPAVITFSSYSIQEEMEFAYNEQNTLDVPVVTTAGEPIFVQEPVENRVISISKNLASVPSIIANNGEFTNRDLIRIRGFSFPANTMKFSNGEISDFQYENGIRYVTLSFKLYHNPKTWIRKLRNAGYVQLIPTNDWTRVKGKKKVFSQLQPILVGTPPTYPSFPIPLRKDGSAYPELIAYLDLMSVGESQAAFASLDPDKLKKIWQDAVLYFRTKKSFNFQGTVPLA